MNNYSGAQEGITVRIATAVADEKGVDETDLPPLYESIDPDALERLFRNGSGKVMFEYAGSNVTVHHNGIVELAPHEMH